MTSGSPVRHILGFALPMMLGILFQQFYNMVDTMVVGKWIGVEAIAGVGSTGSINFMIVGFCIGVGTGCAIPVARSFGAKDHDALRKYVANSIWLSIVLCAVITVIVSIFCRDILVLMQTPDDIIDYAYDYIFIIFLGLPVLYAYNLLAAIIRALGDSKTPVYFLMISAFLNVILDLVSVIILKMGVMGPAIATVISQLVSAILCYLYIVKKFEILKLSKDDLKPDRSMIFHLASMGLPMGFQYSITAIGSVILQASVNSISSAAVAAIAAGSKISAFFVCPFDALGSTMATYAGQNAGIGSHSRIKKGVLWAMILGTVYSVFAFVILFLFGDKIALLFLDADERAILADVHTFLIIISSTYILLLGVNVFRFAIQGMGHSPLAIIAGVLEMIARSLIGFAFVPHFGYVAACFASPLAWVFADIFLVPVLFICCNKMKRKFESAHPELEYALK